MIGCEVYVLRNARDCIYVGTTSRGATSRMHEHNTGNGSLYTRGERGPWTLIYTLRCLTIQEAIRIEVAWLATLRRTGTIPFLPFTPADWGPKSHPRHPGTGGRKGPAQAEIDHDASATPEAYEPPPDTGEFLPEPWTDNDPDAPEYTRITPGDVFPGAHTLHLFCPITGDTFFAGTYVEKGDAIATAYTWQRDGRGFRLIDQHDAIWTTPPAEAVSAKAAPQQEQDGRACSAHATESDTGSLSAPAPASRDNAK